METSVNRSPRMNQPTASQEFALALTRHQTSLYGYILSLVGDRHLAEDVLQQVNVTLLQKADDFETGTDFLAWACTVARFTVLHARRSLARDRLRFSDDVVQQVAARLDDHIGQIDDRRHALRGCLEKLTPEERSLVERRYESGSSVQRLAEASGRTVAATSQKLYRIRASLLECVRITLARES